MALERDNTAERLARIDKLLADMKPTPAQPQIARLQRQGPDIALERDNTAERLVRIDAKQLVALREWPGWPWKTLDPLAVEVATIGRLREAVDEADRLRGERMVGRSHAGSSNSTAQVPVSDFSDLEHRSNVFYKRLRIELHRVLRRSVPLSTWKGWD
jgi:hypothetical protein